MAIERVNVSYHLENVTTIIKELVPSEVFVGVADVFYKKEFDIDNKKYIYYPTPENAILYWAGKTNLINASWYKPQLIKKYDYTDSWNVRKALDKGTPVIIAVGNMSRGAPWSEDMNTNLVPVSATSPFDITAGALKNGVVADYSFSNPRFVDYFADGFYNGGNGTSYAAPRITGYISQIMDWYPNYNYSQIRTMLEKNSTSIVGKNNQVVDVVSDIKKEINGKLDAKVLVEDLIEIFQGRNPTDQEVINIVSTIKYKSSNFSNFYDETVAQAFRIYKASFDRIPDAGGLDYWITQMDQGMTLDEVATQFVDSTEFKTMYTTNDLQFITKLYNNVLDRDPDSLGIAYWLNEIKVKPKAKILADFSESQENKNNVLPLINNETAIDVWDNVDEIINNITKNATLNKEDVPLVDQISALYHVFQKREPTNSQLKQWVDVYEDMNGDWGETLNAWIQTEQIKLLGTFDFNYQIY